ncbi:MAG: HAMP domain-containing histidine kinase [Nitrosopumilus sp.]|nr:HAMP domain-containing histidine kinase [Nitrosopumilus sp.]
MEIIQKKIQKKQENYKDTLENDRFSYNNLFGYIQKKSKNLKIKKLKLLPALSGLVLFSLTLTLILVKYNNNEITLAQTGNLIGFGLVLIMVSLTSFVIFQNQIKKIKSLFISGFILFLILFSINVIFSNYIENQIIKISEYHDLMSVTAISTLMGIEVELERNHGTILSFGLILDDNLNDHKKNMNQINDKVNHYSSLAMGKNSFGEYLAPEPMRETMIDVSGSMKNSLINYNSLVEDFILKNSRDNSQIDSFIQSISFEKEGMIGILNNAKEMEMRGQEFAQNQIGQFSIIQQFSNVLFFGFILISLFSVVLTINESLKKNVQILKQTTEKISQGHFETRIDGKEITEFSDIGNHINQMAVELGYYQEKSLKNEKQRAIGELAARVSHDIRNPLSVLKMDVAVLKRQKKLDEKQINRMENSIERISHQVNEVLDFVRQSPLEYSKFNLSTKISHVLETMRIPSEITINKTNDKIFIFADKHQIEILLINLILNAIQEIKKTGTIDITVSETDKDTILEITDSGPGITLDPIEQIFEPLVTTKQKGTGLGLVSVKSIVDKHKGTISVKNNPTTFTIKIPRNKV